MDQAECDFPSTNAASLQLLRCYAEQATREPQPVEAAARAERWFPRIACIPGVDAASISPLHGELIAQGWLLFQLEDGQRGLTYRVSPEGKQELRRSETGLPVNVEAA